MTSVYERLKNLQITRETASGNDRTLQLSSRYIRLGPFQVDQQRQEVTKGGSRLKLQGKVYQVFLALIEKQGEVVTREEIRARLWPADTHVNCDANVNTTVNKLRQALGDSSDQPLYIETIPGKGYCLVVPAGSAARKSELWITFGVIALILTGMLLGAVVTKLWTTHFAPLSGGS